ncbi:hypothetical protein CHS0354_024970 [Potamilus streckersoni]|uniref:Uncharacterized protein n=1 Tax=Potamilus streckersoni TaxID=2493646 RepID=A0AAE0T3P6_9BIVA|nr:hypothetical protein CHS0354_024970 [Potamilus streckersoni]
MASTQFSGTEPAGKHKQIQQTELTQNPVVLNQLENTNTKTSSTEPAEKHITNKTTIGPAVVLNQLGNINKYNNQTHGNCWLTHNPDVRTKLENTSKYIIERYKTTWLRHNPVKTDLRKHIANTQSIGTEPAEKKENTTKKVRKYDNHRYATSWLTYSLLLRIQLENSKYKKNLFYGTSWLTHNPVVRKKENNTNKNNKKIGTEPAEEHKLIITTRGTEPAVIQNQLENTKHMQSTVVRNLLTNTQSSGMEQAGKQTNTTTRASGTEPAAKHKANKNSHTYGTSWLTHNPMVRNHLEISKQIQQTVVRNKLDKIQSSGTDQDQLRKLQANKQYSGNEPAGKHKQIQQTEVRNQLAKIKSSGTELAGKNKVIRTTSGTIQLHNTIHCYGTSRITLSEENNQGYGTGWLTQHPLIRNQLENTKNTTTIVVRNRVENTKQKTKTTSGSKPAGKHKNTITRHTAGEYKANTTNTGTEPAEKHKRDTTTKVVRNKQDESSKSKSQRYGTIGLIHNPVVKNQLENTNTKTSGRNPAGKHNSNTTTRNTERAGYRTIQWYGTSWKIQRKNSNQLYGTSWLTPTPVIRNQLESSKQIQKVTGNQLANAQ